MSNLRPISELCTRITSGGTPSRKREDFFCGIDRGHRWVKSKELLDCAISESEEHITDDGLKNSSAKYLPANTVLVAMYGANVGQMGWLRSPATVNQAICGLAVNPDIADFRYVYYALLATRDGLIAKAQGAAQQNLNQDTIKAYDLPAPHLSYQHRIASILSAYDDLIENNTRRIAILEEMARRIYEEWFVRFCFPGHEQVKMVESELGLIPEGWGLASVDQCVTVRRGKSYKSSELTDEGGLPFVNLKCMVRDGGFRKSGLKRFLGTFKETQKVATGDLVMAVTDMTQERRIVARCGRVPRLGSDFGVISMDLVKIEANKGVPKDYLYGMLRWSGFADEVKQHANGANVLHLLPDRISDYRFVLPSANLAQQFADVVGPMLRQCDVLAEKDEVLRTTRDLLLPKLISGELDVSNLPEPESIAA